MTFNTSTTTASGTPELAMPSVGAFSVEETHKIALSPTSRLIAHSERLGWRNIYASVAVEEPWSADLPVGQHHCVAFCLERSARIERTIHGDGRRLGRTLTPRQFGVIPAGVTSSWSVTGSPRMMLIYLRDSMVKRAAEEVFGIDARGVEIIPRLGEIDPLLEQLAMGVFETLNEQSPDSGLYVDSVAHMIAVQLLRRHIARPPASTKVRLAQAARGTTRVTELEDFIEASLDQDLSLERLAAQAGLNPSYLVSAFSRTFGTSPHKYVMGKRLERAKHLLRATQESLCDVALQCGFSSQSHFTTSFSSHVGVSPGAYRRRLS